MVTTSVIPQAAATATEQTLLVEFQESAAHPYCTGSTLQPLANVSFQAGAVRLLNGNAVVPITAVVAVTTPACNGRATTQLFTETFDVAFVSTTANTITLTQGDSIATEPAHVKCCKASAVKVLSTLLIEIA